MNKKIFSSLRDALKSQKTILSDGASGTYLHSHGLEAGASPEELNLNNKDLIKKMSKDYYDSGSDIVLTNTFGGNPYMLKKYGLKDKIIEINETAAKLSKSVAQKGKFVLGSIGPTGEFLEPLGSATKSEMKKGFISQMKALENGGADGILIETMTALEEAQLAIESAKENTDLVILATMTFDLGPKGFFTMMGITPETAANELRKAGADVVGSNCGNGIDNMIEIANKMRSVDDGHMIIHSNAGIPKIINGRIVYPETPQYMAEKFKELIDLNIDIIGGCCGTTPQHIKEIHKILN